MREHDMEEMFHRWPNKLPAPSRRRLLGAGAMLLASAVLGRDAWAETGPADHDGLLVSAPYPALLMQRPEGVSTVILSSGGKLGVAPGLPTEMIAAGPVPATVRGSLIARGGRSVIALIDRPDAIRPFAGRAPSPPTAQDLGEVQLTGALDDARSWFGAPAHQDCAASCAHAGLPLTFRDLESRRLAPTLFLDETGRPHGRAILAFVANPLAAKGRLVRLGDLTQFRVAVADLQPV